MRVAVLGTGILGAAMARQLVAASHEVVVWNRTPEKAEAIEGVSVAESPVAAVAGAEVALTLLADGRAVDDVVDRSVLEAFDDGAPWLQMSTVGLDVDNVASRAREAAVAFVDAPVLGTKEPAERGELLVIAAGPAVARERCEPVFEAVGERTLWLGDEPGTASRLKLVINAWLVGLVEALAESVALAKGLDVDPQLFLDAIDGGPVGAPYARIKGAAMIQGEFPTSFPLRLALKDARLVVAAAQEAGVDARLARTVASQFERAVHDGHGDEDMAAVYNVVSPT